MKIKSEEQNDQLARFKEAAKQVEADQNDDALDKVFGKIDLRREPEKKEYDQ